jgi:hypothetical protein
MAITDDLVAYYQMEEATGLDRVDGSGQGYDLQDVGAAGVPQDAVVFQRGLASAKFTDGNAETLRLPTGSQPADFPSNTGTTPFTISGWYLVHTFSTGGTLWEMDAAPSPGATLNATSLPDLFSFSLVDSGTPRSRTILADAQFVVGTWYHVLVRWNGPSQEMSMFIDGVQQSTTHSDMTVINAGGGNFQLGDITNPGNNWNVDDLVVWQRGLTDPEVADVFGATDLAAFLVAPPATGDDEFSPGPDKTAQDYIDRQITADSVFNARRTTGEKFALGDPTAASVQARFVTAETVRQEFAEAAE